MKLRATQRCPVHPRQRSCICRGDMQPKPKKYYYVHGVKRIPDSTVARGYREFRSPAKMRELLDRKIAEQNGRCGLCGEKFDDYTQIDPEHIEPKGLGGAFRDDHPDNIQAAHRDCNARKGSQRITLLPRSA